MVTIDPNRDYYRDLGLTPSNDAAEIKREYRKLVMKYHPDRNPGKEAEVKDKFQIIQAAYEILQDPDKKRQYDVSRTMRPGHASGVRGNPWEDVSRQYPAPPRRHHPTSAARPQPSTGGAQRYDNFASQPRPSARTRPARNSTTQTFNAWQSMRPQPKPETSKPAAPKPNTSRPVPPPPPPPRPKQENPSMPRTTSQKQRQEAAFGTSRKSTSTYYPSGSSPTDEPASRAHTGYTREPQNIFEQAAAANRQREASGDGPDSKLDARQPTPYQTQGGEKTNPFDGVPLARAKSSRDIPGRANEAESNPSSPRQRSSSLPRDARRDNVRARRGSGFGSRPSSSADVERDSPRRQASANSRKSSVPGEGNVRANSSAKFDTRGHTAGEPHGSARNDPAKPAAGGPPSPVYGHPHASSPSATATSQPPLNKTKAFGSGSAAPRTPTHTKAPTSSAPSGELMFESSLTPFEKSQRRLLAHLVQNSANPFEVDEGNNWLPRQGRARRTRGYTAYANVSTATSFGFPNNVPFNPPPGQNPFVRTNSEDISTAFSPTRDGAPYTFSAGAGSESQPTAPKSRSASVSRQGRRSPTKRGLRPTETSRSDETADEPADSFDSKWSGKVGPESFAPQLSRLGSNSPTRRGQPKRVKSLKSLGKVGMMGEDSDGGSTSSGGAAMSPAKSHAESPSVGSPNAMDIDSPPRTPANDGATRPADVPRNIPVEPSNPEWRSGDVSALPTEPTKPFMAQPASASAPPQPPASKTAQAPVHPLAMPPFSAPSGGSEDTEEFRTSFADFKNVEPFAHKPKGLASLANLKQSLPFDSQASGHLPVKPEPTPHRPLDFPSAPCAPAAPTISGDTKPSPEIFQTYFAAFEKYLRHWETFNAIITNHFATRQQMVSSTHDARGLGFLSNSCIQQQRDWLEQDQEVLQKWAQARLEHSNHLLEFTSVREKMGSSY